MMVIWFVAIYSVADKSAISLGSKIGYGYYF